MSVCVCVCVCVCVHACVLCCTYVPTEVADITTHIHSTVEEDHTVSDIHWLFSHFSMADNILN